MNPINPWLDPAEVRRLAEKLLAPVNQTLHEPPADPGFDSGFVGFAASPPPGARERRAPARPDDAPVPAPVTVAGPAAPPQEAPATQAAFGPFLDRLHLFRDWLQRHFATTGIFILDRDGAVIFDDSGHGKVHFLARSLALASRRPGCPSGNVHLKIGTAALEVIPVETPAGWLVLGAVVPAAIPPASIPVIIEALTQVVAPPGKNSG